MQAEQRRGNSSLAATMAGSPRRNEKMAPSRTNTSSSTSLGNMAVVAGDNPLKSDPELVALLKKLPTIVKYKYFHRWKKSFLDRLLPKLAVHEQSGIQVADEASDTFDQVLSRTARQANKVVELGNKSSVKATLALRELGALLTITTDTLEEWIPATAQQEKKAGYTKFHLGAALIQQGFPQYITLTAMQNALSQIESSVSGAAEQLPLQAYTTQVQRFCDVMADLGMYEIMKKCLEFAVAPDVEESSDEEIMEIVIEGDDMQGRPHSTTLEVEPSETLASLAATIQGEFGIPLDQLTLQHDNSDVMKSFPNADETSLGTVGIQDGDTMRVGLRKIPLIVHSYNDNDKGMPIEVTCRNTLQDIKDMAKATPPNQRIFRQAKPPTGVELTKPSQTVFDYGLCDGEHLYMEPSSIKLQVSAPEMNKTFDLEVGLDWSARDIQVQIAKDLGMAPEQFKTTIPKSNKPLPSSSTTTTVRDLKLRDGDALRVGLETMPLKVQTYGDDGKGKTIDVTCRNTLQDIQNMAKAPRNYRIFRGKPPAGKELTDPSGTVQDYGLVAQEYLYLEPQSIALRVEAPEMNQSFTLDKVRLDDASKDIQEQIAAKLGMELPQFTTTVQKTKQKLPSHPTTVRDLKLRDGETLKVGLRKIPLIVHAYGDDKGKPFEVTCRNTLQDIQNLAGAPSSNQRVLRGKSNEELADPNKTVQDYALVDQEHLYLEPKSIALRVQVPELKKTFDLELSLDDTSKDILGQIATMLGMDSPSQFSTLLERTKKKLPSQATSVRDLKLQDGDALNVSLKEFPITVKRKAGGEAVAKLTVHPTRDSLGSIKGMIQDAADIDPAQQILYHDRQRLDGNDSQTVHALGLQPQSVLYLDSGPVEIKSSGEIYVSFRMRGIKEAPKDYEYNELAKVTEKFYAKLLKRRYGKSGGFVSIAVKPYRTRFEAGIPSPDYNVCVEWDFTATFDTPDDGSAIPTRHALCTFLVQADLSPYLAKVGKMPTRSCSKAYGVYTQQTYERP